MSLLLAGVLVAGEGDEAAAAYASLGQEIVGWQVEPSINFKNQSLDRSATDYIHPIFLQIRLKIADYLSWFS